MITLLIAFFFLLRVINKLERNALFSSVRLLAFSISRNFSLSSFDNAISNLKAVTVILFIFYCNSLAVALLTYFKYLSS